MTTHGVWGFKVNGAYKLTYIHYDGYPNVLGREVIELIKGAKHNLDVMAMGIKLEPNGINDDKLINKPYMPRYFIEGMRYMADWLNGSSKVLEKCKCNYIDWLYVIDIDQSELQIRNIYANRGILIGFEWVDSHTVEESVIMANMTLRNEIV